MNEPKQVDVVPVFMQFIHKVLFKNIFKIHHLKTNEQEAVEIQTKMFILLYFITSRVLILLGTQA